LTTVKIAMAAPRASPSVATADRVKPGVRRSERAASLRASQRLLNFGQLQFVVWPLVK